MTCHCPLCTTTFTKGTNPMPHEIEYHDGRDWIRDGFATIGGWNPWRYERKDDAAYSVQSRHHGCLTRVVPARAVCAERKKP